MDAAGPLPLSIRVPRHDPAPAETNAGQKSLFQHRTDGLATLCQAAGDLRDGHPGARALRVEQFCFDTPTISRVSFAGEISCGTEYRFCLPITR